MNRASAIYRGIVTHARHRSAGSRPHAFGYRLYMLYVDLDELPELLAAGGPLRAGRFGLLSFARRDYIAGAASLAVAARDRVEQELGFRPAGPVRLLTHVRSLGYAFNPVSFYFCFAADGTTLEAVVAEITNTPWGERQAYVLRARRGGAVDAFDKRFHVSPFFPMEQRYRWAIDEPGERLRIEMASDERGEEVFRARLELARTPWSVAALWRAALGSPVMAWRVHAAIYWQALRLWVKGAPFHVHPRKRAGAERMEDDPPHAPGSARSRHPGPALGQVPGPAPERPRRAASRTAIAALVALLLPGRVAADERFVGTARLPDGRVAYVEEHEVRHEGDRISRAETRYLDAGGRPLARLLSDYARAPFAPDYRYEDLRTGEVEEVALREGALELRAGERRRLMPLDGRRMVVAGQGLDRLTRARLAELARGEVLAVSLALPSRLEVYDFRIRALPAGSAVERLRVRIEPASFLLRLLAPAIEADYEVRTGRLLAYRGVSNVAGPGGEVQQVEIEYRYPEADHGA